VHEGNAHCGLSAILTCSGYKELFAHETGLRKNLKFNNSYHYQQLIKTKKSYIRIQGFI
jgi:hypothetical protein